MKINKKRQMQFTRPQQEGDEPATALRFTSYAWAKLHWFCHHGETEIGGFGVSLNNDLLLIEDFVTVAQSVSAVHVSFDDNAVADLFETQVDAGRKPAQFARIWLHTHPGESPYPSALDEDTFARVFGGCDWAVMFILGRTGKTYARLRFNIGPRGQMVIPVGADFSGSFPGSDHQAWLAEYLANVEVENLGFGNEQCGQAEWELVRTPKISPDELEDFVDEREVWL